MSLLVPADPTSDVRSISPEVTHAVDALAEVLYTDNYAELYRQISGGALIAPDIERARSTVKSLDSREQFLLGLLALGTASPPGSGDADCAELLDQLARAHLVTRDASTGMASTSGWIIVPVLGGYLMTGTPAPYRRSGEIGASGYVGNDSLLLAGALGGPRGKRVLDIGCGSGVQGLLAARGAAAAVLTDVDEFSLRLSTMNAHLNSIVHPVSIRQGSLYAPVQGEQFDLIAVLPPYVPRVEGSGTSAAVDGGRDGLEFIRPLLRGASEHLFPGGEFVTISQLLCDDDGPLLLRELSELAPELEVRISVTDWHPLQPYALDIATRLAAHGAPVDEFTLTGRYVSSLRGLGATGICTADIRAIRRCVHVPASPRVVGRAPLMRPTSVPLPTGRYLFAENGDAVLLTTSNGTNIAVNRPTADLLRAADGVRTISQIVECAWGATPDADSLRLDLEDQAIARFVELENAGIIGHIPG